MNGWSRWCLVAVLFTMQFGMTLRCMAAEEPTRTFPAQKCRYTLPGPDWSWADKQMPNMLFMAGNSSGFVVNLTYVSLPKPEPLNEQFVKGFESTFYKAAQVTKRAGRFVTFRGRPAYQADGLAANGRTTSTLVINANGTTYMLTVIGAEQPIETDPTFESIRQGFDFTIPSEQVATQTAPGIAAPLTPVPAAPAPAERNAYQMGRLMGGIAAICLLVAGVAVVVRALVRKPKPVKRRNRRDD